MVNLQALFRIDTQSQTWKRMLHNMMNLPDFNVDLSGTLLREGKVCVVRPHWEGFGKFSVNFSTVQLRWILGNPVSEVLDTPPWTYTNNTHKYLQAVHRILMFVEVDHGHVQIVNSLKHVYILTKTINNIWMSGHSPCSAYLLARLSPKPTLSRTPHLGNDITFVVSSSNSPVNERKQIIF